MKEIINFKLSLIFKMQHNDTSSGLFVRMDELPFRVGLAEIDAIKFIDGFEKKGDNV